MGWLVPAETLLLTGWTLAKHEVGLGMIDVGLGNVVKVDVCIKWDNECKNV